MSMKFSRRNILKSGLLAGTGLSVFGGLGPLQRLASANDGAGSDLHYIFAYFSGGWDILLSLDPRDPAVFNIDNVRDTQILPAYDLLQNSDGQLIQAGGITFGPYIGDLAQHADKLSVIRGISMETLTHEAGRRRFLTGKPPSGLQARGSSAATWLAARLGQQQPIPNLAVQVESYNTELPNFATALKANGVPDLIRALRPAEPRLASTQSAQLDHLLKQVAACKNAKSSPTWQAAEAGRLQARDMAFGQLDSLFDFSAPGTEMAQIRAHYQIPGGSTGLSSPEAQAAMAAQAIKGGVSRCVSIQAASGLDTHFQEWATDQGPRQQRGFNAVARLIEDLQASEYKHTGDSWLDHTVIVGFSEFSRTSMLNTRDGRDHSLTNAAFVAGACVKGGTVVGRSSDIGMEPTLTNLSTGEFDLGGEIIRPEHILRTLMVNAGITEDDADLRVEPIAAIQR